MIGRHTRQRGFGLGPYGKSKWWIAPVRHDGFCGSASAVPVTKHGLEIIEVLEIVRTDTLGDVAIYRHWIEDPDGAEIDLEWIPKREVVEFRPTANLTAALRTMGMKPLSSSSKTPLIARGSQTLQ